MAIHDLGYARWTGTEHPRPMRIWTIAREHVRLAFSVGWMKWLLLLCFLAIGGYLFLLFIRSILPPQVPMEQLIPQYSGNNVYRTFLCGNETFFLFALIGAAAGGRLLSADLAANAVPLYLSRPLTKLDYLLGKAAALAAILLLASFVPAILLWIGAIAVGVDATTWGERLLDLWGIAATSAVVVAPMTAAILAFSSMTRRPAMAGIYWILFILATFTFAAAMTEGVEEPLYELLSWPQNLRTVAPAFFEERIPVPGEEREYAHGWAWACLAGVTVVACGVLAWRFRRYEET